MTIISYLIYNATRNAWLSDDKKTWSDWYDAVSFFSGETAEEVRLSVSSNEDVTFTMAWMQ